MADKTKNTMLDLNDYLFMEIERLSDEELSGEALDKEIQRAKGLTMVADKIIQNANTILDAQKLSGEFGTGDVAIPRQITG